MHTSEMIHTNPTPSPIPPDRLAACIEACFDCAQACEACADACLGEPETTPLLRCIRLNRDCADICATTGRVLSRLLHHEMGVFKAQLEACQLACEVCAAECAEHAEMHEHCRVCAEACRRCANECRDLLTGPGIGMPSIQHTPPADWHHINRED